jgi:hypothetical protein
MLLTLIALALCGWVQLAKSAALSERAPEQRFLLPHRTFTKVYHFKSTTTVVAPAVCFSIPAHLSECGPGIQPSTTMYVYYKSDAAHTRSLLSLYIAYARTTLFTYAIPGCVRSFVPVKFHH